jgi:UbiD family decarboxylase
MEDEGPFGEFTDGYVAKAPNNVMRVTAITRRKDAIYHVILAGGPEDSTLLGVPLQTEVYKRVSAFGKIRDIGTPGHIFGCVVALEKTSDEQARAVMLAALAAHPWMKVVIVVDADVDVHDPNEVLWAVHTRNTPETGIYMIPRLGSFQRADVRDAHRGKVGIDATAPMSMRNVFRRRQFPGMDAIDLDTVLDPLRPL